MSGIRYSILSCAAFLILVITAVPSSAAVVRASKPRSSQQTRTAHELLLLRRGITPDTKGLAEYLRNLRPNEKQRLHARQLVKMLGSGVFAERDAATRELASLPQLPVAALKQALAGNDLEVRWRARALLKARQVNQTPLMYAIFETITLRRIPGLIDELLATIPLCESPYLTDSAQKAVTASARTSDSKRLRSAIRDNNVNVQIAAINALSATIKREARDDLRTLLEPPTRDDGVVFAAARGLANIGDRKALMPLVGLLSSKDARIRSQAAIVLRSSTGQNFGFASYAKEDSRNAVTKKWNSWIAKNGTTAALRFPLVVASGFQSYLNGNTLLACGYKNKVVEFSPEWKTVWEYDAKGAFSAEKLANGNVLIACYGPNEVLEVTPEKKVVWRLKAQSCLNARQLANGNILIAGHTSKQVLEVGRDQKTVWSYKSKWNCYDAHRLANGNTLISSEKGVIEITPDGKTTWEYMPGKSFYGIQALPNGNLLLAGYSTGEVFEITREKKTVWAFKTSSPFDAFRLPNGNTLYKRVVQHGSQMRSSPVTAMAGKLLADGIIGEVKVARAWTAEVRNLAKPVADGTPPAGVDYDRWLGPASKRPFNAFRFHRTWRYFRDYANGEIGDDGIHDIDMARWGLGVETHPIHITARGGRMLLHGHVSEYPDNMHANFEYADGRMLVYENYPFTSYGLYGFDNGNAFYGPKGYMVFSRRGYFQVYLGKKEAKGPGVPPEIRGNRGRGYKEHMDNFLECVRTRAQPVGHARLAHLSCSLVHLGNVAYNARETIHFDPDRETIKGNTNALLEKVADKIKKGTTYREVLAALFLAAVRNVEPRPAVGFKFHAVLVVNSAHLASMSSPASDRWLPIFWALDYYKGRQIEEERKTGWKLPPVKTERLPKPHKAKEELISALENWDEQAADAAAAAMVRSAGANETFELLFHYGSRDFRSIGHKAIFAANAYRSLGVIGWEHAEPIVRSLVYAMQNRRGNANPAKADLPADRPYRHNRELAKSIRADWRNGRVDEAATRELLTTLHDASAGEAAKQAARLLNKGVAAKSLWDSIFLGAGELLMRQPGIIGLHGLTTMNAIHYAFQTAAGDENRRLLLLQGCSFLPMFREAAAGRGRLRKSTLDDLKPAKLDSKEAVTEILSDVSRDRARAAGKIRQYLQNGGNARELLHGARRLIFYKGNDAHDYKFSSAVLEDFYHVSPKFREQFLATAAFNLTGSGGRDNPVVERTKAAFA
eukprot:g22043.t1